MSKPRKMTIEEKEIERLTAQLESLRKQKWQPIETAPRDGNFIDLYAGFRIPDCRWLENLDTETEADFYSGSGNGSYTGWVDSRNEPLFSISEDITHWQHLPLPPQEQT